MHERARGQPRAVVVGQFAHEGVAHQRRRGEESRILRRLRLLGRLERVVVVVVVGVEVGDETAEAGAPVREAFLQVLGRGGIVDGDAVVVGVEGFDEVFVELRPQDGDVGAAFGEARVEAYDWFAEVEVDESCGGEFGGARGEGGGEGALVVIVAMGGGGVFAADVDDGVAGGEEGGVAGTEEARGGVGWEEAEKVDC